MKLLSSIISSEEVSIAIRGGADMIDIHNPVEGSLGACNPKLIMRSVEECNGRVPISTTIGELSDAPTQVALAAHGAYCCGVDFVKVGVGKMTSQKKAAEKMEVFSNALTKAVPTADIMLVGYADYGEHQSINPKYLQFIAKSGGCKSLMLDTKDKGLHANSILDVMSEQKLKKIIEKTKKAGLKFALAGGIDIKDLGPIRRLNPDIIALRKNLCLGSRDKGRIDFNKLRGFKDALSISFSLKQ